MELLEYQAKELFRQVDIPVLPSQIVKHPGDIKQLQIPYPIVLKSQVRSGGRGKAGGIKFANNTIDAAAAAQTIFRLPIRQEYPSVLLAEAKYNARAEFYLCIVVDRGSCRPLLLGSAQGGVDVEESGVCMQQVLVEDTFSPFYARRLALQMGLTGEMMLAVSNIVEKMYVLFEQKDLDLVEINPLGISADGGEVMALDGKVTVNDHALPRHPDLLDMVASIPDRTGIIRAVTNNSTANALQSIRLEQIEAGNIGVLCCGAGLCMSTLDLLYQAQGKPASILDLEDLYIQSLAAEEIAYRVTKALEALAGDRTIEVLFVNLLATVVGCDVLAQGILNYVNQVGNAPTFPKLVVRLAGRNYQRAQEILAQGNIEIWENLDRAVATAVDLSREREKVTQGQQ
ncbi:succinate--CoA ligase subunit beta [Geitlerinema sp. PCC 9228]|uniref:succinate--CoA ligase subunit beta n=1 Tax=Geitlerinema sp. PCC 9228 TaxID=111611 RepID=UPI0008F98950|nr:succinate--CoA ligase subunit beta [Geitlerinema sp. PCC 9228]